MVARGLKSEGRVASPVPGPVTQIPADMLRPDVLLCFGEDREDWAKALRAAGAEPTHEHQYRGVEAWCNDAGMAVLAPWGSAAVEAVLWELTRPGIVERAVLWGTAGSLPAWTGPADEALAVDPAQAHLVADMPYAQLTRPTLAHDLTSTPGFSTDRFYGASPTGDDPGYGDPTGWAGLRDEDAIIDMETAPFYHLMERFAPETGYLSVRAVANPVSDLDALPAAATDALVVALAGAMEALA